MLCPNCESENREGAKFCDECGFPLTGAIAARAAEAAAVADERAGEFDPTLAMDAVDDAKQPRGGAADDGEPTADAADAADAEPETDELADEASAQGAEDASDTASETGEAPEGENTPAEDSKTAPHDDDFAGLDIIDDEYGERVVGPDYKQPQANWRDGNTMQMPRIEGEEAPRSKDFLASSTTKQNKGKKVAIGVVVALVVVAAIVAFVTYQMQIWGGKVVPDVRGMTEADAASVLQDSGFGVRSTQVKSDDTEGLVLVMDPTAGARANEGDEIVIHIATAREIPAVLGKTEDAAKELFAEAGYENVTYTREHSDEPEGTVLSVSPEQGTRAKSAIAVTVKVAEPYVVPDVSTLGLQESIDAIQQAGLAYDMYYVDTQQYADGSVIGTDPAAGTKVKGDTVVYIQVARARGAQLVQLTRSMLSPGSTVTIDGVSYEIEALGSVEYVGNDVVTFSLTGRPFTYFMGQYVSLESRNVSGSVSWTADNGVASISS